VTFRRNDFVFARNIEMTGSRPQPTEAVQSGWLRGPDSATDRTDFAAVAIGGSAGGLGASEADHDGMPRSAIATGSVDYMLSVAGIAAVLVERERGEIIAPASEQTSSQNSVQDLLRRRRFEGRDSSRWRGRA
jgi:hypothetical protein